MKNTEISTSKFVLKNTKKYGVGVFANKDFKKGEIVVRFTGEILSFDEIIKRIHTGKEDQTDSLQIGLETDMDLDELPRSFNHSCNPNALFRRDYDLVAIKNIKIGEEIRYDYSTTIGPNIPKELWVMRCKCGEKNCRKIIGNILTIHGKIIKKYRHMGVLQDYIKKELDIIEENGGRLPEYNKIVI